MISCLILDNEIKHIFITAAKMLAILEVIESPPQDDFRICFLNVVSLKLMNDPDIVNILVKAELCFACPPVQSPSFSIIKSIRATLLSLLIIALVPRVRGRMSGVVEGRG